MYHTLTPCGQMNSVTWALTLYLNPAAVLYWSRTESDNNPYINKFEFWVKWIWDRVQQWCPGMFVQIGQCWQSYKVSLMWQILAHSHSIQHHRHHQTVIGRSGALLSLPDRYSLIKQYSQMLMKEGPFLYMTYPCDPHGYAKSRDSALARFTVREWVKINSQVPQATCSRYMSVGEPD